MSLLNAERELILDRWANRVRSDARIPAASHLPASELRDFVPVLLDELIQTLRTPFDPGHAEADGRTLGHNEASRAHAKHRFEHGYSLGEALLELSHVRCAVIEVAAARRVDLSGPSATLVHTTIDEAMATAAMELERSAHRGLEERAEFENKLIAIVSHDLRGPLGAIVTSVAALVRRGGLDEKQTAALGRISSAANRATRMIHDLLDFTSARFRGGIPIARQKVQLTPLVRQAVDELLLSYPNVTIDVRAECECEGEWDPDRLSQAIGNLLANALVYGRAPEDTWVAIRETDNQVEVEVHNSGDVISESELPKLFTPFRRGGGQGGQGLGLGLFITKHIVEAHGGRIVASSTQEKGTSFTICLPR